MKYTPHPDAQKRREQMVWRGRGRNTVEVIRRDVGSATVAPIEQ